jgi:formylglycine-generating enzyme required for sulfatase activity
MKTRSIIFHHCLLLMFAYVISGCSNERQITGSVVLTEKTGSDAQKGMIGVRIIHPDIIKELAANYIDLNQKSISDQDLIGNLELQLNQLRQGQTNILAINQLLLECQSRQYELQIVSTKAIDQFFRALPPLILKSPIEKSFSVNPNGRDWLLVQLFSDGSRNSSTKNKPFEFWMLKVSDCRDNVVVGEDSTLDSISEVSHVMSKIAGNNQRVDASTELVAWATDARIKAIKAKEAWELETRSKQWSDALSRIKSKRLNVGDRYSLPNYSPEIVVRAISGGQFLMGSPLDEPQRNTDEIQHKVTIPYDFFILESECTQKQWQALMTNNPSFFKSEMNPVEQVSWDDAVRYCGILTGSHRKLGVIGGDMEWRLPTEAEWEFICRAGQAQDDSSNLMSVAIFSKNSGFKSHSIATRQANPWGLVDIKGNVWEWCLDWYGPYSQLEATNPQGTQMSSGRVLRGGGWLLGAEFCRAASRRTSAPNLRYSYVGFRPVLAIKR